MKASHWIFSHPTIHETFPSALLVAAKISFLCCLAQSPSLRSSLCLGSRLPNSNLPTLTANMATTLGIRSLITLVGAGYTGSFVYNNVNFDRVRAVAAELLRSGAAASSNRESPASSSNANSSSASNDSSSTIAALAAQVDRLTAEFSRRSDPVVVVGSGSGYRGSLATVTDVFNLLGWAVFAVSVGGVVYYVAVRKRISLTDLAWVSRKKFEGTVDALEKGLSTIKRAMQSAHKQLDVRIHSVKTHVEDVRVTLSKEITDQVGEVGLKVDNVRADVSEVNEGVMNVRGDLHALTQRVDRALNGIGIMLTVLQQVAPQQVKYSRFGELMNDLDKSPGNLVMGTGAEDSPSLIRHASQGLGCLFGEDEEGAKRGGTPAPGVQGSTGARGTGSSIKAKSRQKSSRPASASADGIGREKEPVLGSAWPP